MRHVESRIQQSCVTWFRMQYPSIGRLLFAVPNGGSRNAREAGIMKGEGVTAGVSDMILLYPCSGYNCLCIEFKTEAKGSKQSPYQKEWQELTERAGNKYIICRSFDDFHREIKDYFKGFNAPLELCSEGTAKDLIRTLEENRLRNSVHLSKLEKTMAEVDKSGFRALATLEKIEALPHIKKLLNEQLQFFEGYIKEHPEALDDAIANLKEVPVLIPRKKR